MADPSGERAFLDAYPPREYPRASNTVDLLIFSVIDGQWKVLLVARDAHPFKGQWALPGGFVDVGDVYTDQGESLDGAATRVLGREVFGRRAGEILAERNVYLEQLYTFGDPGRDPRMRVITVAYYALVPPDVVALSSARGAARWSSLEEIDWGRLAFDHGRILRLGSDRVRGKIDYSPIAFNLVPARFTIAELRRVHEVIKGEVYDVGNFRRRFQRMITDGVIAETGETRRTRRRPAKLYQFVMDRGRPATSYRVSAASS